MYSCGLNSITMVIIMKRFIIGLIILVSILGISCNLGSQVASTASEVSRRATAFAAGEYPDPIIGQILFVTPFMTPTQTTTATSAIAISYVMPSPENGTPTPADSTSRPNTTPNSKSTRSTSPSTTNPADPIGTPPNGSPPFDPPPFGTPDETPPPNPNPNDPRPPKPPSDTPPPKPSNTPKPSTTPVPPHPTDTPTRKPEPPTPKPSATFTAEPESPTPPPSATFTAEPDTPTPPSPATPTSTPDEPLTLQFSSNAFTASRHQPAVLTVTLSHPSSQFIAVSYGIANGTQNTAVEGQDYQKFSFGSIGFGPDATGKTPTVITFTWSDLINYTTSTPNKTIQFELIDPPLNAVLGKPFTTVLTIVD